MDTDETAEPGVKVMSTHGGVRADAIAVLLDLVIRKAGQVLSETVVAQRLQARGLGTNIHDLKRRPRSKRFP